TSRNVDLSPSGVTRSTVPPCSTTYTSGPSSAGCVTYSGASKLPISSRRTPPRPSPTLPLPAPPRASVAVPPPLPPPQPPATRSAPPSRTARKRSVALRDDLTLAVDRRLRSLVADRDNEFALDLSAVGGDGLRLAVESSLDAVVESVGTGFDGGQPPEDRLLVAGVERAEGERVGLRPQAARDPLRDRLVGRPRVLVLEDPDRAARVRRVGIVDLRLEGAVGVAVVGLDREGQLGEGLVADV